MDVKIVNVNNDGDEDKEYLLLEATENCDIGNYLVADSTYTKDNRISNKLRHIYWFPDLQIKKGDWVSLRTGIGTNKSEDKNGGGKIHRFYWGLKTSVWNDEGDAAVLMKVSEWTQKGANKK